jgi:hypothetical protein
MASRTNPQLTITTDRAQNKATVVAECELEFTQFEVKAMTRLGLRYLLRCELLNMEMLYPESAPRATVQPAQLAGLRGLTPAV